MAFIINPIKHLIVACGNMFHQILIWNISNSIKKMKFNQKEYFTKVNCILTGHQVQF